ncbi:MAG: LacI family DNA-binding transcriptional regulator [Acidimicrobiia bacterium]
MANVTLRDVAEHVGVNVSTVSRALSSDRSSLVSPETRARVRAAAAQLGYRGNVQATALRRGRTGTIGVIVADLSNPFIGPALRGISTALGNQGLLPIMTESRDSSEQLGRICDKLLAQRVDGIIVTAGRFGDEALLRRVANEVPLVLAVRQLPHSGLHTIAHDDLAGGRAAAEHLLELGHTRLAQLIGPQDIYSFRARGIGFRETVAAAGHACDDVAAGIVLPTLSAGRDLMNALLERTDGELPTAVFAHNDSIAVGALSAMRQAGLRCPDDISLVGYNDTPLTEYLTPALTTVRLPGYELGRLAAELVVTLSEGSMTTTKTVTIAPELVVRESTRPIEGSG